MEPGPHGLLAVGEIIGVNALLSGDNALVIALACRALQPRQRLVGMVIGALLAVVLRIGFTAFITQLLAIPFLKLGGGILLLWIAVKLIVGEDGGGDDTEAGETLWHAVRLVLVADAVMSLDNVLAIAAIARGDLLLLSLGLAISIPFVVAGASLIASLLVRLPMLVWAGGGLLGWIAAAMAAEDPMLASYIGGTLLPEMLPGLCGAVAVVGVAVLLRARTSRHTLDKASRDRRQQL